MGYLNRILLSCEQDVAVKVFSQQEFTGEHLRQFKEEVIMTWMCIWWIPQNFCYQLIFIQIKTLKWISKVLRNSKSVPHVHNFLSIVDTTGVYHEKATTSQYGAFHGSCFVSTTPVHSNWISSKVIISV